MKFIEQNDFWTFDWLYAKTSNLFWLKSLNGKLSHVYSEHGFRFKNNIQSQSHFQKSILLLKIPDWILVVFCWYHFCIFLFFFSIFMFINKNHWTKFIWHLVDSCSTPKKKRDRKIRNRASRFENTFNLCVHRFVCDCDCVVFEIDKHRYT